MLAFIDESGHPHPNDPNERSVIVATCIEESDARKIAGAVHALKRDILQRERMELKGRSLLNRRTFRKKPDYALFVEEFFSAMLGMPIAIFAIVMERPNSDQEAESEFLPRQFQFLVERIQLLADERDQMATILFDGDGGLFGGLSEKFNSFLYRSQFGPVLEPHNRRPVFRGFQDIRRNTDSGYGGVRRAPLPRSGVESSSAPRGRPFPSGNPALL